MNKKYKIIFRIILGFLVFVFTLESYSLTFLVNMREKKADKENFYGRIPESLEPLLAECGWLNKVGANSDEIPGVFENVLPSGQRKSYNKVKNAEKRVLLVGCSYLYGMGLKDEDTLAWLLNERFPDVQFDNYGVSGWGTYQCFMLTEYLLQRKVRYGALLLYRRPCFQTAEMEDEGQQ